MNLCCQSYSHLIADVNADNPDTPDIKADEAEPFYGRLEHILILHLPPTPKFRPDFENEATLTLTCISHCNLPHGVDACSKVAMFSKYLVQQYIHMGAIRVVVSLVK